MSGVDDVLADITVTATRAGDQKLLAWARLEQTAHHCPRLIWAVQGTHSHGMGVARQLRAQGQQIIEATLPAPPRAARRPGGKSDPKDAVHAARAALAASHHCQPRAEGSP